MKGAMRLLNIPNFFIRMEYFEQAHLILLQQGARKCDHSFLRSYYPIRSQEKSSSASDWIVCTHERM